MAKNNGDYNLIREDIENEYIEYFDFEKMAFVDKIAKSVDISTIDALTTLFSDQEELNDYLSVSKNNNDYNYKYKIIYKQNRKSEEKLFKCIWNDPSLSSISKLSDNKVDFTSESNYSLFLKIIEDIKNNQNGLVKRIVTSRKESFKLNKNNIKIIECIASGEEIPLKDLMDIFSDYKEYRALYINYKYNNLDPQLSYKNELIKIKEKLFK